MSDSVHAPGITGLVPEQTDRRFVSQHLAAYAFARHFVDRKRVLEIGFGDGHGANYLAEVAREVTGIDMTAANIPHAKAKYPRSNLRFVHMQGTNLEFTDASFDVVGCFQVIEHVPEAQLESFLREVRRVLVPGGVFCLSTLNLDHAQKAGHAYEKHCHHEKEFTGPELEALLRRVFPTVALSGLYLSRSHRLAQRLKKWGLLRWGPTQLNPLARYYDHMSVSAYQVRPGTSKTALDLLAVCRT